MSQEPLTADPRQMAPAAPTATSRPGRPWRTLVSTGAGNALEWFDWAIYAVFVPFFAPQFFPADSTGTAVLAGLAVFAVGFVMRPIGGLAFGWYADRFGRRAGLIGSIGLAAGGSLVVGLVPTHETIGIAAPIVLVLARLAQGIAHGGEMPAVQTYVAEAAPADKRGLWSSMIYFSGGLGILASTVLGAVLSSWLAPGQMTEWGWRIPFVLGGLIGGYTLVMRLRLTETSCFAHQPTRAEISSPRPSMWRAMLESRAACMRVILLTVGSTVSFYMWVIATPPQAAGKGLEPSRALWIGSLALVVMVVLLPFFGGLSDKVGRRPVLLFSLVGLAVTTYPLQTLIGARSWQLVVAMFGAMVFTAAGVAIFPVTLAEMFPTKVRVAGAGFPSALATALFGGTAPYLQTWLAGSGRNGLFLGYATLLLVVGVFVVARMPETRHLPLD